MRAHKPTELAKRLRNSPSFALAILLLPATIIVTLVFFLSLIPVVSYSFFTYTPPGHPLYVPGSPFMREIFTLENFLKLFGEVTRYYLVRTVKISFFSAIACLILGYPIAHSIARSKSKKIRGGLLFMTITMFFVSAIVRAYAWITLLGRNGIINNALGVLGFGPFDLMYNETALIIGTTHFLLPFVIISLIGSIQSIDISLEEASRNMGANEIQTFWKITLPLSLPGVTAAFLLSITIGFGMFVTPWIMGAGICEMMANYIFDVMMNSNNLPFGSALSIFLLAIVLVVIFGINSYMESKIRRK